MDANSAVTSGAGSWNEPTRGSDNFGDCWFVMNIYSPSTTRFSISLASGLRSGGIFETCSSSAAQRAEETLELAGQQSDFLKSFGHPPTHPLGETYHTATPLRFGNYFGKMRLVPVSDNLIALRGKHIDHPQSWNSVKDSIVTFFHKETAVWELRVQLCTDLTKMPVEDTSVEWDERLSPSLAVACITAQPQNAYSDARRVWVDEELSFNPWHSLVSHRPLGNIMRARLNSYQASRWNL